ncbi:MAG: hypothetical protein V3V25_14700, partial [Paracoccaceae bacterium]
AFFPLSLLVVTAMITGRLIYQRIFAPWFAVVYVASWSISHAVGTVEFVALWVIPVLAGIVVLNRFRGAVSRQYFKG